MKQLSEEIKVVPRLARILAAVVGLGVPLVCLVIFLTLVWNHPSDGDAGFPVFFMIVATPIALVLAAYILLIGYIAADSRRRGMRPVLWTLLAIFIPNAIGIILYFILRDPLLQNCPKCGAAANSLCSFCPACGEPLSQTCPACQSTVQKGWSHCGRCGASLNVAPSVDANPA